MCVTFASCHPFITSSSSSLILWRQLFFLILYIFLLGCLRCIAFLWLTPTSLHPSGVRRGKPPKNSGAFSNTQTINKRNRRRNPRVLFPFVIKTLLNQLSYCVKKESKTEKKNFLLLNCLSHPTPKMSSYFILFSWFLFLFCSHFGLLDVDFRNWQEREAASVFCFGNFSASYTRSDLQFLTNSKVKIDEMPKVSKS